MNDFKNLAQGSEEWKRKRIGLFTSSTIGKIICANICKLTDTFKTHVLEKAKEIIYNESTEVKENAAIKWGNEHEPLALLEYQINQGVFCSTVGFIPFGSHAGCSPDKMVNNTGGVEVKCPYNSINHLRHCTIKKNADLKKINKLYYWQVQMCLLCTGRKWWDFVSFDPRLPKGHHLRLFRFRVAMEDKPLEKLKLCLFHAIKAKKELLKTLNL